MHVSVYYDNLQTAIIGVSRSSCYKKNHNSEISRKISTGAFLQINKFSACFKVVNRITFIHYFWVQ